MRKLVLLATVLLSTLATVYANDNTNRNITIETSRYSYSQPFQFNERGVAFFVFPNGEFDFNTHPNYYRGNGRRTSVNTTYGAPGRRKGHYNHYYNNPGVRIEHDNLGRVRRIGNVFINYDRSGRVKRVGSVYVRYHHRLLKQIGGLRVTYDCYGRIIRTTGAIKHNSCHICGVVSCGINHNGYHSGPDYGYDNHDNDYGDDGYYGNDNDQYYYRNNGNKKDKKSPKKR